MINKIKESGNNKRLFLGIGIIMIAAVGVYAYFKYDELYPSTDDAYVGSNLVNVATKVSGYLAQTNIQNNQVVHKGDLLFVLDPKDYQLNLKQAEKNYKAQIDMTNMAKEQVHVQQGQITQDKEQYKFLQERFNRYKELYTANTVSQQDYQKATTDFNNIKTQLEVDNNKYQQYSSGYQYTASKMEAAKAQLDLAQSNLTYTKYYSPVDGYVTNMSSLAVGEFINASQQLFGIVDTQNWWVDANFKETQLKRLKIGQPVAVKLDMYDHKFKGIIQSISYASGNTFSLLPAQNATGNWVKVTQRFTVRIKIQNEAKFPLRVGASANITVNTI